MLPQRHGLAPCQQDWSLAVKRIRSPQQMNSQIHTSQTFKNCTNPDRGFAALAPRDQARGARKRDAGNSTRVGREYPASPALINLGFRQWPHMFSARRAQSEMRRAPQVEAWQRSRLERTSRKLSIGLSEPGHEHHALLSVHQLTRRPIDRILKFVSAGLARPHVANAVIGKMLRPVRFDQSRTALRALIA